MTGTNPDDVDDLFDEADDQSRTEVEAADTTGGGQNDLQEEIVEQYRRIREGDATSTLTLRDQRLAAIIRGLDEAGELDDLADEVWDAAPGEADGQAASQSGLLSGLLRLGLQAADDELFEEDETAFERYRDEHENQKR